MSAADKTALDQLVSDAQTGSGAFSNQVISTVGQTGDYNDLINKPARTYDIASYASGAQGLGTTVAQLLAPRNLTLTGLNQTGGATVKVQVAGVDVASYPKSVTTGQLIAVVVSVAGTNITFTLTAVEA